MHSEYLDLTFDLKDLETEVSKALKAVCRLKPIDVRCTYPVFRGEVDGHGQAFVKIASRDEWLRTAELLHAVKDCHLFPRFLVGKPIDFGEYVVFVMEWRTGRVIRPEDMTDAQIAGLVSGCAELSSVLQNARGIVDAAATGEPERLFTTLAEYVGRHPLVGRFLKDLVSLPVEQRVYGGRELSVVHGDFHSKNFLFEGDTLACVFDFDRVTFALGCGDLINALVERFSCLGLSRGKRRLLASAARKILAIAPWRRDEMEVMINVGRLRFAARRIDKHPNSLWVALDILRRDLAIRRLLECLPKGE